MNPLEKLHECSIAGRRARRLSTHVAAAIPPGPQRVLDVGCGDGRVSRLVWDLRPDIEMQGAEVRDLVEVAIPFRRYDGDGLPYDAGAFDVVLLLDVLHHAEHPWTLLADAVRVARRAVIIKDHLQEGPFARWRLKFMDRVGNRRLGLRLPEGYWRRREWQDAFARLAVETDLWREALHLYPWPLGAVFDARLHFLARCRPHGSSP